jgi:hypothetical protein
MINNSVNIWVGTVVDINDPLKANRVKVRIFGLVDDAVLNEDLPWSVVQMPVTSSSSTGIGENHNLKTGSTVTVSFLDGTEMQIPIVTGTISGFQETQLAGKHSGFELPIETRLAEPDTNRIARNENNDYTVIGYRKGTLVTNIQTAFGAKWSEPETLYNSIYPYNRVTETISGHVFEIDDTKDSERIHQFHKSGTFEEIFPDGSDVNKIVNDKFEIVYGDDSIYIKGNANVTIEGTNNVCIVGDSNLQVYGNVTEEINGNVTRTIHGNVTEKIDGNLDQQVLGNKSVRVSGDCNLNVHSNTNVLTSGVTTVGSGGNITMHGDNIHLNTNTHTISGSPYSPVTIQEYVEAEIGEYSDLNAD